MKKQPPQTMPPGNEHPNKSTDLTAMQAQVSPAEGSRIAGPCVLRISELPLTVSEDDIKAIFADLPGYKSLVFRASRYGLVEITFDNNSAYLQAYKVYLRWRQQRTRQNATALEPSTLQEVQSRGHARVEKEQPAISSPMSAAEETGIAPRKKSLKHGRSVSPQSRPSDVFPQVSRKNQKDESQSLTTAKIQASTSSRLGLTDTIQLWQNTISHTANRDSDIAPRLFQTCSQLYARILAVLKQSEGLTKSQWLHFERTFGLFRFWGDAHEIDRGELNSVFEQSSQLHEMVLSSLLAITKVLSQRLLVFDVVLDEHRSALAKDCASAKELIDDAERVVRYLQPTDPGHYESESEISDDDINEVAEDLRNEVECLMDTDPNIRAPIPSPVTHEPPAPSQVQARSPYAHYVDLLKAQFPEGDYNLLNRLGELTLERFLRGQRERDESARQAELVTIPANSFIGPIDDRISKTSEFKDSGVGSSVPLQSRVSRSDQYNLSPNNDATSYAASLSSALSSLAATSSSRFPTLSQDAKQGTPFVCDACGLSVVFKDTRKWKRHLFQDLQPYSCLWPDCKYSLTTFDRRELWLSHIGSDHHLAPEWKSFACPLCQEHTGHGWSTITRHLARHLDEIALTALPRGAESDLDSDASSHSGAGLDNISAGSSQLVDLPWSLSPIPEPALQPSSLQDEDYLLKILKEEVEFGDTSGLQSHLRGVRLTQKYSIKLLEAAIEYDRTEICDVLITTQDFTSSAKASLESCLEDAVTRGHLTIAVVLINQFFSGEKRFLHMLVERGIRRCRHI